MLDDYFPVILSLLFLTLCTPSPSKETKCQQNTEINPYLRCGNESRLFINHVTLLDSDDNHATVISENLTSAVMASCNYQRSCRVPYPYVGVSYSCIKDTAVYTMDGVCEIFSIVNINQTFRHIIWEPLEKPSNNCIYFEITFGTERQIQVISSFTMNLYGNEGPFHLVREDDFAIYRSNSCRLTGDFQYGSLHQAKSFFYIASDMLKPVPNVYVPNTTDCGIESLEFNITSSPTPASERIPSVGFIAGMAVLGTFVLTVAAAIIMCVYFKMNRAKRRNEATKSPPSEHSDMVYSSLMKTGENQKGSRINSDNSDGGLYYSVSDVPVYTPDVYGPEPVPNNNLYSSTMSAELASDDVDDAYDHIDSSAAQPILFSDDIDSDVAFSRPGYMVITPESGSKNQSNQEAA